MEHNAFGPWLSTGDEPEIDVLSLVTIQGSANLQHQLEPSLGIQACVRYHLTLGAGNDSAVQITMGGIL